MNESVDSVSNLLVTVNGVNFQFDLLFVSLSLC